MSFENRKKMLDTSLDGRLSKGRDKYTLDDGQVVDKYDVAARVPCSLSSSHKRLKFYSDPAIIFLSVEKFRREGYASIWRRPKEEISAEEIKDKELNKKFWKLISDNI